MQIPDTPVVVPPTPIGSDMHAERSENGLNDRRDDEEQVSGNDRNGKVVTNDEAPTGEASEDPDAGVTIFESPSDETDAPAFPQQNNNASAHDADDGIIFADSPAEEGPDEGSDEELPGWLKKRMEGFEDRDRSENLTTRKDTGDPGKLQGRDFGIERQETVLPPAGSTRNDSSSKSPTSNGNTSGGAKTTRARSRSTSPEHHRKSASASTRH